MYHTKRIAKNSVFQGVALVAEGMTEVIVGLSLARMLGAEQLGQFITLVTLAGMFAFISAFGLPSLLTREIARLRDDPQHIAELVNTAVGLVMALSIVTIALMLLLGMVAGYSATLMRALFLTAVALGVESTTLVVAASFRGIEDMKRSSTVNAIMELSFTTLAVVMILFRAGTDVIMAVYLVSRIIAFLVATALYRPYFGKLRPALDWQRWRALLRIGLPFSINSVFSFAYSRVDVVVLSFMTGSVLVGFYAAAYSLTMRLNILARTVTQALYPFLSHQHVSDERLMRTYAARSMHLLIMAAFLIAAIFWVFGHQFMSLVYGESFANTATDAVKVLALAIPLRFIETSLSVTLDATNRSGQRATAVSIAAIANVLLNILLIPRYQLMGPVYATLLTEVLICGLFIGYLRGEVRHVIAWRSFVAPVLGALLILSIPLLLSSINVWILIILSVAIYVLTIAVLDRETIKPLMLMAMRRAQ